MSSGIKYYICLLVLSVSSFSAQANEAVVSDAMPMSYFQWLGMGLVVITLLQGLVFFVRGCRRFAHQERINHSSFQLWKSRVTYAETKLKQQASQELTWNGYRKFEIIEKRQECKDVISFYLTPHDGKAIPDFKPGQYLTFRLKIPGQIKPVVRCYSLSDCPREGVYRITIKREYPPKDKPDMPPGLSSSYFHDRLQVSDLLDVQAPSGRFHLDPFDETPVILVGGGIGLTPVLSMLNAIIKAGANREVWFFYGVRNKNDCAMRDHLQVLAEKHSNLKLTICFNEPESDDEEGVDYQHQGFISADLFQQLLPSNNYEFYVCGPPPMMTFIVNGLLEWNVPENKIFYEAFGPASIKTKPAKTEALEKYSENKITVDFHKSGIKLEWDSHSNTLLEFAEKNGVIIDSGCRAGNCGTCLNAIISGDVTYISDPESMPDEGYCLACCCIPQSNLVLDA